MIRNRTVETRDKLVGKLPVTGELLRGSLLERTVRHSEAYWFTIATIRRFGGLCGSLCRDGRQAE